MNIEENLNNSLNDGSVNDPPKKDVHIIITPEGREIQFGSKEFHERYNNSFQTGKRGPTVSTILKRIMDITAVDVIPEQTILDVAANANKQLTVGELIALKLVHAAVNGNIKAMEICLDRTEGKAKETIEVLQRTVQTMKLPGGNIIEF